ncbi:MAG: DUF2933 domain-containing protein [Rhodospirillaceae bacterium]|nr:MAG: DUF2933 domain-containing protein [Rhodospirillaceae bacterium]
METAVTPPSANQRPPCHRNGRNLGSLLGRRRELYLAGSAAVLALSLALSQHWLTLAALAPFLYILPCALMMFVCMKGMGHNRQTALSQDAKDDKPVDTGPKICQGR